MFAIQNTTRKMHEPSCFVKPAPRTVRFFQPARGAIGSVGSLAVLVAHREDAEQSQENYNYKEQKMSTIEKLVLDYYELHLIRRAIVHMAYSSDPNSDDVKL